MIETEKWLLYFESYVAYAVVKSKNGDKFFAPADIIMYKDGTLLVEVDNGKMFHSDGTAWKGEENGKTRLLADGTVENR